MKKVSRPYKIKALKDSPLGGMVRKGEIGVHTKDHYYDFPSQKGYSVGTVPKSLFEIVQQDKSKHKQEPQYEIY